MIWGLALALFAFWLLGVLLGKGGFIHVVLLCAVTVGIIQWLAERRASKN